MSRSTKPGTSCVWGLARPVRVLAFLLLLMCSLGSILLRATQVRPSEYDVKAAYLFNFGKFVQWPGSASAAESPSFTICIMGDDPFGHTLKSIISGEKINGKPVVTRHVSAPEAISGCHILFISEDDEYKVKRAVALATRLNVLTVSDIPDFVRRGGMIGFNTIDNKVRFEVNLKAAQRAGLSLSSELLKVASTVLRDGAGA